MPAPIRTLALALIATSLSPLPADARKARAADEAFVPDALKQLTEKVDAAVQDNRAEEASLLALDMIARLDTLVAADDLDRKDSALTSASYAFKRAGRISDERAAILQKKALTEQKYGVGSREADLMIPELADTYRREGRTGEGERVLQALIAERSTQLPPGDARIINLLQARATLLEDSSRLAGTVEAQREILALQSRYHADEPRYLLRTTRDLCWNLGQLGRYSESIDLLRAAIPKAEEFWRSTGATEDYNGSFDSMAAAMLIADFQSILADHLGAEGPSTEADELFKASLAWRNRYQSRPTPIVARAYNAMAFRQNFQGRFEEAEVNARTALDIMGEPDEPDITIAKYKYNLAAALLGQGKADEAIPLLRYGVPVQRKGYPDDHPDLAILLSTLASALAQVPGNEAEALTLAREATSIARKHRDARIAGGYKDSVPDPGSAAIARALGGDMSVRDPLAMAYGALMEAYWAQKSTDAHNEAQASEAFMAAQDLEQSVAGQAMAEAAARTLGGSGPLGMLVGERQDLVARARALNAELARAMASGEAAHIDRARQNLAAASDALAKADAAIRTQFPDYEAMVSPTALGISDVQKRLKPDEALLLIVPRGDAIYAFGVTAEHVKLFRSEEAVGQVRALVRRVRCRVDEASCTTEGDLDASAESESERQGIDAYFPRFDRQAAHALYANLIAPLEPVIGTAKTVFLSASGDLSGIPFPLLVTEFDENGPPDSTDAKSLIKTKWLGDKYSFITLPAVSALKAVRPLPGQTSVAGGTAFLGYGAPALGGTAGTSRGVSSVPRRRVMRSGIMALRGTGPDALRALDPLPGTETELKAMAGVLSAKPGTVRLGAAATETAFRADPTLSGARVLAIATHGLLPRELDGNAEPALVFTPPATASANDDGLLTASEAAQLKLTAEWVILSACNTAAADGTPGAQSLSGLARAFLHAGAKALLASHWRVSDEVTSALTVETLRLRRTGKLSRAESLRQAMTAIRTGKRADGSAMPGWQPHWAHPAAWAPFILVAADGE